MTFNAKNLNAFIAGYIEALFFADTATNSDGETVENLAGLELSIPAMEECRQECVQFLDLAGSKVMLAIAGSDDYDHAQAGRDFWFSRQGHGAGFWDRGLGMVGDDLHNVAEHFGEKHLYIENSLIEVE